LQILTVAFIALQFVEYAKSYSFLLIGFAVAINPNNLVYAFAGVLFRKHKRILKVVLAGVGLLLGIVYLHF
jgi:hypothetical protein